MKIVSRYQISFQCFTIHAQSEHFVTNTDQLLSLFGKNLHSFISICWGMRSNIILDFICYLPLWLIICVSLIFPIVSFIGFTPKDSYSSRGNRPEMAQ